MLQAFWNPYSPYICYKSSIDSNLSSLLQFTSATQSQKRAWQWEIKGETSTFLKVCWLYDHREGLLTLWSKLLFLTALGYIFICLYTATSLLSWNKEKGSDVKSIFLLHMNLYLQEYHHFVLYPLDRPYYGWYITSNFLRELIKTRFKALMLWLLYEWSKRGTT